MSGCRWVLCLGMVLVAAPRSSGGQDLRVSDGTATTRVKVSKARGYPAFPVTVLARLGARVERHEDRVDVRLFGDTLRFRPGFPEFRLKGAAIPLTEWAFEKDRVLFLPQRFYTHWLPERYPERLRFEDGMLAMLTTTLGSERAVDSSARSSARAAQNGGTSRVRDSAVGPADRPASSAAAPAGAQAPSRRRGSGVRDPDDLLPGSLRGFIDGRVSGVFDSNIDHEALPQSSYGTVGRLAVGVQSARSDPFLAVRYDLGFYRFANSDRWNRTTHDLSVELAPAVALFRLRLGAAVRVGSWTEDRELANQLILRPALEIRPHRRFFVSLYGEQRIRRITGSAERADTSRLAGVELVRRWAAGGRWELDGRYEGNESERPESRYDGWAGRAMVRVPLTRFDRVALELTHRRRRYRERLVEVDSVEVPREDRRWTPALSATHEFSGGYWSLELEYEVESNRSNESDAAYLAHRVGFTLRRRW
ncbi:MAG TPA: hypothetical protein VGA42_04255 [Gemmatimonadales bacterium]